jgi:hypothetical protein
MQVDLKTPEKPQSTHHSPSEQPAANQCMTSAHVRLAPRPGIGSCLRLAAAAAAGVPGLQPRPVYTRGR